MIRNLAYRGRRAVLTMAIASAVSAANAAPVTLNFSADFGLNFSQHPGGTAMAQLVDTAYGPGTGTGQTVAVSGSITYDAATGAYQHAQASGQSTANYLLPITGATFNLWGGSFAGDISGIAGALPYFLQTGVSGLNGCLGIVNLCSGTPTGNAALVII